MKSDRTKLPSGWKWVGRGTVEHHSIRNMDGSPRRIFLTSGLRTEDQIKQHILHVNAQREEAQNRAQLEMA